MISLKGKYSYILAPHVLQKHLNDGDDTIVVDFGDIKAEIKITGTKSAEPVVLKGGKNESPSHSRSNKRNNAEIREAERKKQPTVDASEANEQETEVEG